LKLSTTPISEVACAEKMIHQRTVLYVVTQLKVSILGLYIWIKNPLVITKVKKALCLMKPGRIVHIAKMVPSRIQTAPLLRCFVCVMDARRLERARENSVRLR
jgi:hypothetical protein